jgi:replicative DNA helicase
MGSPGVGKTALWLQSALHVARRYPVAMVQLEMTPAKMGMRALASMARVSFKRMRRGADLSQRDWQNLSESLGQLAGRSLLLAPNGVDTLNDIKGFFRRCVIDHGVRALFLDNLKIVNVPDAKGDLERFNRVTRELKLLARALDVPIVAIHHMHRMVEGSRPSLTSGYGSSSVEQDADNVLALWRPDQQLDDEVELLPLKTRDDWAKAKPLRWVGDQQRYETMHPSPPPPSVREP